MNTPKNGEENYSAGELRREAKLAFQEIREIWDRMKEEKKLRHLGEKPKDKDQ